MHDRLGGCGRSRLESSLELYVVVEFVVCSLITGALNAGHRLLYIRWPAVGSSDDTSDPPSVACESACEWHAFRLYLETAPIPKFRLDFWFYLIAKFHQKMGNFFQ